MIGVTRGWGATSRGLEKDSDILKDACLHKEKENKRKKAWQATKQTKLHKDRQKTQLSPTLNESRRQDNQNYKHRNTKKLTQNLIG